VSSWPIAAATEVVEAPGLPIDGGPVARLRHYADQRPADTAFIELRYHEGHPVPRPVSYAELDRWAATLAARLRMLTPHESRIAILCQHGIDYIVAFLACLYSGRIAVPLYPVGEREHSRCEAVLADARPAAGIISDGDSDSPKALGSLLQRYLCVGQPAPETAPLPEPEPAPAAAAYLQYTSGSTRNPAGVLVTHSNLATALAQLCAALPASRTAPIVTWLPFFHDMGLVLGIGLPLFAGVPGVTMAPLDFVKRPIRWLRACTDYRAAMTASPNFGLALAVSATTASQRNGLDLSALDVVLNGAEPIRAATLDAFTNTFGEYGFRHRAHTPGYGLAEATLPVTVSAQANEPVATRFDRAALSIGIAVPTTAVDAGAPLIGCGVPVTGQQVAVVDPQTSIELMSCQVGEIWVSGANVCAGYRGGTTDLGNIFDAVLAERPGRWLRTGDLGFWYHGQLYLTDRLGNVIVIDGRNHYPTDIEATVAESTPQLRVGRIVAFGYDDGERERLVVVAEAARDAAVAYREIVRGISAAISGVHGIAVADIILTAAGRLPKTTSGKLRRGSCREQYLAGALSESTIGPAE